MKKSIQLAVATLLVAGLAHAAEPVTSHLASEYFPLTKKSRWTYRIRDFAKNWTYRNEVRVHGHRRVDAIDRSGIQVEDRYSSDAGPYVVEELEPILYFWEGGFLHRMFLTYQGGKLISTSGSGEARFLPERLEDGLDWKSLATSFNVGHTSGMSITQRYSVHFEPGEIEVPAGRFKDTVRIDIHADHGEGTGVEPGSRIEFYYSDWYAPGVGHVLGRVWDDEARLRERTRIELIGYDVQPGEKPAAAEASAAPRTEGAPG